MLKKIIFIFGLIFSAHLVSVPFAEIQKFLPKEPVILDCGAHNGDSALLLLGHFPDAKIIAVEADPLLFDFLEQRVRDMPSIHPYQYALCDVDGEIEFFQPGDRARNSAVGSIFRRPDTTLDLAPLCRDPVVVPSIGLDTLCDQLQIQEIDFMYLDMQGGELGMLKGAPNALAGAKVIFTEVLFKELYEGAPLYQEVRAFLEENGFVFQKLIRASPNWGDALFVRKDLLDGQ